MGIVHGLGGEHGSCHQGIGLIQPFLALVLVAPIAAVQEHVAPEGGVAGKQLIGAFAGQHHLVVDVPHMAAHQIFRHAESVVDRALGVPEGRFEMVVEVIA